MKPFATGVLFALFPLSCLAWINYDDKVEKLPPEFGKDFQEIALMISTKSVEFEQEMPEPITVTIKNSSTRATLVPPAPAAKAGAESATAERFYSLHIVLADKEGASAVFSRNVLTGTDDPITSGKLPAPGEATLVQVPFEALEVARVEKYENGLPVFDPARSMSKAGGLMPQLYTLEAILISGVKGARKPDFVVASNVWQILLRPKSAARMDEAEKQAKLKKFMAKLGEGAYGGIGVSSQLAALGELGVDPLIEMAENSGDGKTRESRIWAIVTLCSTGSPKAEAYILKRLQDPIDFGDLAFLTWHSQGFNSPQIRQALQEMALAVVTDQPLPWEKTHGPESRIHGRGSLKYILQHLISAGQPVPDEVVAGSLRLTDEEPVSFAIQGWKPTNPDKAVAVVKPLFLRVAVSPGVKRPILSKLAAALRSQAFPELDRQGDVDRQWQQAGRWLRDHQFLSDSEFVGFLRCQVLNVRTPELQAEVLALLQKSAGPDFPVKTSPAAFPRDWVATWQWALKNGNVEKDIAVRFLCGQMRTTDELDPLVKKALLAELKPRLGPDFPLKSVDAIDLETDWENCGNWLIEKGFFGKPKPAKAKAPAKGGLSEPALGPTAPGQEK